MLTQLRTYQRRRSFATVIRRVGRCAAIVYTPRVPCDSLALSRARAEDITKLVTRNLIPEDIRLAAVVVRRKTKEVGRISIFCHTAVCVFYMCENLPIAEVSGDVETREITFVEKARDVFSYMRRCYC